MESKKLLAFSGGMFFVGVLCAACAHDEGARVGASDTAPTSVSDDSGSRPSGSDFSPEYRQQMENAERDAESKKQSKKKRDRRVDDIMNRSDRREN